MKELKKYREQIAYLFFGVVTTVVSWGAHILFVTLGMSLIASSIFAWTAAVGVAFFTNRWWVFKSTAKGFKNVLNEAIAFIGSRALLGVFEIVSIPFLADYVGIDGIVFSTEGLDARAIVSVVVVVGNYFISKVWIFKDRSKEEASLEE